MFGRQVIVPARDRDRATTALEGLGVEIEGMDLINSASIDAFATRFLAAGQPLHMLVNSAGIMACPLARDARGYESQFATNHLGHFHLVKRLWPALRQANGARVVSVSSWGHRRSPIVFEDPNFERRDYDRWSAYGQSKTANILFAVALDERGKADGVRAFSLHPGSIVGTGLGKHLSREDFGRWASSTKNGAPILDPTKNLKTVEQGAATSVWCATSPQLDGMGGVYCENCDIASLAPRDNEANREGDAIRHTAGAVLGVMPYAIDRQAADRLDERAPHRSLLLNAVDIADFRGGAPSVRRSAPLGARARILRLPGWKENSMSGIRDKVVAITGASSGIGEATALLLAERGAKLVLGARRSDRLAVLADRIAAAGGEAAYASTDVKRRGDLSNLVKLACERYGKLDVLVNNAGIGPISPLDELRVEDWEDMIDVNIKGVLYGIAAALPVFRAQGFGHFVNTASTAESSIAPNMAVYLKRSSAVRALSEGLRQEAGDKLRVTVISPGFVHTDFAESMTSPEMKAGVIAARDKLAISPDAIARAIAFAIEQPADVDVGEIIIRPTAQG